MQYLYELIDFLPIIMQPPIVALIVILVGYFFSKIFAAIAQAVIPTNNEVKDSDTLTLAARVSRSCFWGSWLVFILVGFNELPLLSLAINKWQIGTAKLPMQLLIMAGAILLLSFEKWLIQPIEKFVKLARSIKFPKAHKVFEVVLIRLSWVLIVVISGFALDNPTNPSTKIVASFLVIALGIVLGNAVKITFSSVIGIKDNTHSLLPKILFYFVFVTFLVTSIGVWLK